MEHSKLPWQRCAVNGGWDGIKSDDGDILFNVVLNNKDNINLCIEAVNNRQFLIGLAGNANTALAVYRNHLEHSQHKELLADIDSDLQELKVDTSSYDTLKAKAELLDEATDLRSELYVALGVLILATPTGNYRNDLTDLNIRFMEHLRKVKALK